MADHERIPDWALRLLRHPLLVLVSLVTVLVGVPAAFVWYLDLRNDLRHEENLRALRPEGEPTGAVPGTRPRVVLRGARVYVPLYSHVFVGDGERLPLSGTLSIRNTDANLPLTVTEVEYFDTRGESVRQFVDQPLVLRPLGSHDFLIGETDDSGGAGANFVVEWVADDPVSAPVIEAVMVGRNRSGVTSFSSRGVVVERLGTEP